MSSFNFRLVKLNGTILPGTVDGTFDDRPVYSPIASDGQLHRTSDAIVATAPMARFDTIAVRTLVGLLNTSAEIPVKALDGTAGLDLIGLVSDGSLPGYITGTVHPRRGSLSGMVALSGLSWSPGAPVKATCDCYFTSASGSADPVVRSAIALPTLPQNTEQLMMASIVLGGATLTRIASFDVQVAHQIENNDGEICRSSGLPYPVELKQPGIGGAVEITATVECLDVAAAPTSSGSLAAVFNIVNPLGIGLSGAGATATIANALIREVQINGTPGKRRFEIRGTLAGSTRPLTVAQF